MGFLGLGVALLLVGILLIMLVTRMTARNLKLTALAFIFILAATAVIIFAIAGRYGLAAPAGALALWGMRAYLLARQIRASTPPPAKLLGPRTCVHSGEQAQERSPTILLKPFGAEEKMPSQMMTAGITCLRSRLQ